MRNNFRQSLSHFLAKYKKGSNVKLDIPEKLRVIYKCEVYNVKCE